MSEKPVRSRLRRLVDWINLTGVKKVHSLIDKVAMAWGKVKANRGSGGIDGLSLAAFEAQLNQQLDRLRQELKQDTYQPQPVRQHLFQRLRVGLAGIARRAECTDTSPISPHRLRHTWASEMLRGGMSLPALKELMGHKDIRMTLRYLKVTQPDLQREFYRARHNIPQPYCTPSFSVSTAASDLPGVRHALAATRHLLQMYRRRLFDNKISRRIQRLNRRLLDVDHELITSRRPKNEERLAGQS